MASYEPVRIWHHQVPGNSHKERFDQLLKKTVPGLTITNLGLLITMAGSMNEKTNRRKPKYRPCGFVINESLSTGYSTPTALYSAYIWSSYRKFNGFFKKIFIPKWVLYVKDIP